MSWYTLQTSPNYENKVIQEIEKRMKEKNLPIHEIFSPEKTIIDYKNGKKIEKKKKLYSNYIFLNLDYSEAIWHAFKGIKGFTGFVGNKSQPMVVPDKDIEIMKNQISDETPKHKVEFPADCKVRITKGSFAEFYGTVKSVDYEKNKAKVLLVVFNRETEVDLEIDSLEISK